MINYLLRPRRFLLQWHITEGCNWRCRHCYQDGNYIKDELTTEQLFDVLKQYIFLIKKWNLPKNKLTLNITGGEPFVRKDFFEFLEKISKYSYLYNWGLLSNGSFLTKENIKKLKLYNISHCQVSLEGLEKNNDLIRGTGAFKQIIKSIELLVSEGVRTVVSLTLTKQNIGDIAKLTKLLSSLDISTLGTRRLIPYGKGGNLKKDLLQPEELKNYYNSVGELNKQLKNKRNRLQISIGCESGIYNNEVLNESVTTFKYCGIIDGRVLIVMPNGDVFPCRRLPIVAGNAMKQSLFEIYYTSNKLWELRNLNNAYPFCQKCKNFHQCFGGAKCVTYCYSSKLFVPDIQCWRYYEKLEKPEFFNEFKDYIKNELELVSVLKNEDTVNLP